MERFSGHARISARARLLAVAVAAGGMMAALPVSAADEVNQERLLNVDKEPGNWLHHHQNYSAHRFSTLKEINRDNVKNLKVAWTMHLGGVEGGGIWSHGGLEGTPIAENGFLYVTDGWGSVYKIDAHGGRGVLVWKMDPKTDRDWAGAVACCGVDNRGVALWGDLVISHTLDGRLIATNKETGQVAWQRTVADPDKGEVDHRRAVDRQEHGDHRRGRRGVRHPWLDRRHRSHDREGGLAHPYNPGQGRARQRNLERRATTRPPPAAVRPG